HLTDHHVERGGEPAIVVTLAEMPGHGGVADALAEPVVEAVFETLAHRDAATPILRCHHAQAAGVAALVADAPPARIGRRGIRARLSTERRAGDDSHLRAVATLGFVEPLRQALFLGRRQDAREIAHPSVRRDRVLAPPRRTTREQG